MFFILLISFCFYNAAFCLPIASKEENNTSITIAYSNMTVNLNNLNGTYSNSIMTNISRIRVKRENTGASKFTQASKMPQIKQLRLFLQMFKNLWDDTYIGGSHPLHPNVPKAIVALFKLRIMEFFFPPVGETKEFAV